VSAIELLLKTLTTLVSDGEVREAEPEPPKIFNVPYKELYDNLVFVFGPKSPVAAVTKIG